ncbi:MAG: type IV pilus twitching motility protein PilT [Patescibacteria group bacterium]
MELDRLLRETVNAGASDLHLTAGLPPVLRIHGELNPIPNEPAVTAAELETALFGLLSEDQRALLRRDGQVDLSVGVRGLARFRVNIYRQRSTYASVMRVIPTEIQTLEMLGLPEVVKQFTEKSRGLVLVTGPTGSGKTTTLASMIDLINCSRSSHIITLEDPIEFLHRHKRSIINQREITGDCCDFTSGLRSALREDPDVILVGEMRDLETIATAISAAETGHLVLATLHTNDTVQTVDRIVDMFPPHQQQQIRVQLAAVIQGVVSQQLIPRIDRPGRVLAAEILVATPAVRALIREAKTHQIYSVIQTGARFGMQTMDSVLRTLCQNRTISVSEALLRATDQEEFKRSLSILA